MNTLRQAAQAVLDRWDSPRWEWDKQGPTADLMATLRAALEQPEQEPTCPKCQAAVLFECVACSSNNYPKHTSVDTKNTPASEQEPIGWLDGTDKLAEFLHRDLKAEHDKRGSATPRDFTIPVYLAPPAAQRKPLTLNAMTAIEEKVYMKTTHKGKPSFEYAQSLIRATEAAHGIKENT